MQLRLFFFPQLFSSWIFHVLITVVIILSLENNATMQSTPCDKSRQVFNTSWGIITDGPLGSNYTKDSHCEWLIRAKNNKQFITLTFQTMGTECSFDYIFVYDGDSFDSPLLGTFSGKTEPQQITAISGSMLILLYSDTNYVLGGFEAEFSVSDCPRNCTGHGKCILNSCICENGWNGKDCSIKLCPDSCGSQAGRGFCQDGLCKCSVGFSGQSCSLHINETYYHSWHWLSSNENGLTPRAAHTAVYDKKTDSLYIFGGYDLKNILDELLIYRFNTSTWEDENGMILDKTDTYSDEVNSKLLFMDGLTQLREEKWGKIVTDSFLQNFLHSVHDNSTLNKIQFRSYARDPLHLATKRVVYNMNNSYSSQNSENKFHYLQTNQSEGPGDIYENNFVNFTKRILKKEPYERPSARYGHAACKCLDGFVIYGGKLANGSLSDELWFYNVTNNRWYLRATMSKFHPPKLTRHTLTLVNEDNLYLFGGSTLGGEFSSQLYFIKLNFENISQEQWKLIRPRGGKELDLRIVAHTTVYYRRSDSLLVYGGITADVARFSRLSDRMFLFKISKYHWSEIHYPRAHLPDVYVPRERAFHTSTILGNYLIVFGGYTHRHNKEEICYDNQMYLYHLGCHTWVSHDILGLSENGFRYRKHQGVFAHTADVRNGNTLLIFGGYHGNMNADLWAYVLPPTITSRDGEIFEPEKICNRHHSLHECTSNPECGWCSADEVCYGRTVGVNCTTNLQTTRCPGVCPALGDCHSCLIHDEMTAVPQSSSKSVVHKLRLGQCIWCVQNARCHHKDDNYGVCGLREDTPSQSPGWWGPQGTEISSINECRIKDRRPGLTFIKYNHPVNWSQPDSVSIINATTADFDVSSKEARIDNNNNGGIMIARLIGFLRIPDEWVNVTEILKMCTSFSNSMLKLSQNHLLSHMQQIGNLSAETSMCQSTFWPSGKPVHLNPGRYLVDFESKKSVISGSNSYQQSKMALMHSKNRENSKTFTFEYLEPYQNGSCHIYSNCLHCLTDSLCGWCDLTGKCFSRNVNESQVCRVEKTDDWHYLILQPSHCANCSNFISCEHCVASNSCEWLVEEARCYRQGYSLTGIVNSSHLCPTPCHLRRNCSQCLDDKGLCVWCEATQECFSFSVYTSEYQFGLCREWIDKNHESNYQLNGYQLGMNMNNVNKDRCKSCSKHFNCSSCLHSLSCGWCYDIVNPITGVCVSGNFNKPQADSCSELIGEILNQTVPIERIGWSYAQCPDIDECLLGLDNCHKEAICTNTDGSFICECKRGFYGDGRHSCIKTCYNKCIHGLCTMAPDYFCQCDLGWTGDDCGIDCGCNNHSTCSMAVGMCDKCQDWTTGDYCQFCRTGSFGNATSKEGCHVCKCNGHGDESRGLCDSDTGICFCQHNTEGNQCEKCKKGFYGNPMNGGICYYQCAARGMVTDLQSQGIGSHREALMPWEMRLEGLIAKECLWILNGSELTNGSYTSVIQLNFDNDININCQDNGVFVFDGLPDLVSSSNHQNHALGTFCQRDDRAPLTVETKSGILTVLFKQGHDSEGFNASFNIFTCPNNCPSDRMCVGKDCVCRKGWMGINCSLPVCPQNCSFHLKQGYCDKGYGRCICREGYGNIDCSSKTRQEQLIFTELFNSATLSHSFDHLRKMIPRFGHSLVTDRRGSLWMLGGYSLSHGPLNDIRLFDTKNNTWMQVTVDSTRDATMPLGRYFHAAEIVHSRREIFVYGGICAKDNLLSGFNNNTLKDFWKFSIKHQRWIEIEISNSPPPLAGHTLTLIRDQEKESLLLVGGFSPEYGFLDTVWNFNLETGIWSSFNTLGNRPINVCGHTNVYHSPTKSFYLFGGYIFSQNRIIYSNKLYSFHYPSLTWSLLPTFEEYNPVSSNLPQVRFLHSAITTKDYMLVFGGKIPHERGLTEQSDFLIAYSYSCNQWIRILSRGTHVIGSPPPLTYGQAMTYDPEMGSVYIVGGFDNTIQSRVTRINLPTDLCNLWNGKEKCRSFLGCSFCSVKRPDKTLSSLCYSSLKSFRESCDYYNGTLITNNGVVCDEKWFEQRSCEQFKTCTECLAKWPIYLNERHICKWCSNCARNKCIPYNQNCRLDKKCHTISNMEECNEISCVASNCEKCKELKSCNWTGKSCITGTSDEQLFSCPPRCSDFKGCTDCLSAQCLWSTALKECISPAFQPLYCAGGVCGLVLKEGNINQCPEPCSSYTQCSTCLKNSHCGWCAISNGNLTGQGVCTEGSLSKPFISPSCLTLLPAVENSSVNWNYVKCPEENECDNGHHTCNRISEQCIDLKEGFKCDCGPGYKSVHSQCEPVCTQGCVRGSCTAPNVCTCDFGYVGANCSIQCQCNGHSNCAGPDKLDICLECHNNTKGAQCNKCKPLFVGNPMNNGHCIPCYKYCNEHTHICINDSLSSSILLNKSMNELNLLIEEGPEASDALCIGCVNKTTGRRCDGCLEGYFRGTDDLRHKCRPCECHGHGDRCDPVTGEKCNCGNNTESECQTSISKNSNQQCWMLQCSKCKESYSGTPTNGHQCYKQMTLDHKFCFDSKLIEDCELKPKPLYPGQLVFFQVQPRYVNVDIRIILDVTRGSLDLYMSPKDDSLIVLNNSTIGHNSINWDPKYRKKTIIPSNGDHLSVHRPILDEMAIEMGNVISNWSVSDVFYETEQEAEGLTTYITVNKNNTFLHVKNICDRLIITLPKDKFDLISTRFYLALQASSTGVSSEPSYGILFFRQDQLHIDLFVFFSVFFSCFFLFLACCVVAWKAKQAADIRRARRRHVVEMLHMAKRPFAGIILHLESEESEESSNLISQSSHRKKRTKPVSGSRELRPVAIEPTDDGIAAIATVFVRLPGGVEAPVQLSLASSLIMLSRVYPLNGRAFLRRRSSHHGPV